MRVDASKNRLAMDPNTTLGMRIGVPHFSILSKLFLSELASGLRYI